ncbi:uncharacterized protein BJ212DRAFT_1324537 [Suillus subaureus]|uniref:Uncharacterized protein n=1 Tax=Suillus subaureus TaxID=48587 RepID=A0A9P7DKR5_9AGAM|nr:uncharacterized protein BJ212DRAFT_1406339 [Suillus subaureus]XP_041197546.1 uncharacterized protein BJ212DRAFT_1324537 [Suillus subaureus]KAG1797238.1 hypothetical protein BJ212DRAFT_1406339 [Suillus subaureus]KAG1823486.1 hypothetical protein BJ212DRAFT_1324537 [Suillus subaureus]
MVFITVHDAELKLVILVRSDLQTILIVGSFILLMMSTPVHFCASLRIRNATRQLLCITRIQL